jgi:hypothetical protein
MKETPRQFEKRTGLRYAPSRTLRAVGRVLGPGEPCPTLFRYPGPFGLARLLEGGAGRLAPEGASAVWLSDEPATRRASATRLFGSVAVMEPLRLRPVRATDAEGFEAWLGRDGVVREGEDVVWVPAGMLDARYDWDGLADPQQVRDHLGGRYDDERRRVQDTLGAYVEELSGLARAGVAPPATAWHELSKAARRRMLASAGLAPRFSR